MNGAMQLDEFRGALNVPLAKSILFLCNYIFVLCRYELMYSCWNTIALFRPTAKHIKDDLADVLSKDTDKERVSRNVADLLKK